jgi:hypothetical protein
MFACRLENLTSKFVLIRRRALISKRIEQSSDLPCETVLIASITTLESLSKMMLVQPLEEATRIASRIAKASPSGTVKL